jgi:signal transduction histidine kinase
MSDGLGSASRIGAGRPISRSGRERLRSLSHELGPPVLYHNKLDAVFEWLAGQMESTHGLTVQVEIHSGANSDSEPVRSFLYRTAQEILFNVAKHAHVQEAKLRLQRVRDELWLIISDKGRGFDPAVLAQRGGFGLSAICERAELLGGHMTIKQERPRPRQHLLRHRPGCGCLMHSPLVLYAGGGSYDGIFSRSPPLRADWWAMIPGTVRASAS